MKRSVIHIILYLGEESGYVAECINLPVVTQGKTIDETVKNIKEAISLHLEGEDLAEIGISPNAPLVVNMELEPINV